MLTRGLLFAALTLLRRAGILPQCSETADLVM